MTVQVNLIKVSKLFNLIFKHFINNTIIPTFVLGSDDTIGATKGDYEELNGKVKSDVFKSEAKRIPRIPDPPKDKSDDNSSELFSSEPNDTTKSKEGTQILIITYIYFKRHVNHLLIISYL